MGMVIEVDAEAPAQERSSGPGTRPEQATDHTTDPSAADTSKILETAQLLWSLLRLLSKAGPPRV